MLTQCPGCQTVFRVTGQILRTAHGEVRCGQCTLQFDAIPHLLDDEELASSEDISTPQVNPNRPDQAQEDAQATPIAEEFNTQPNFAIHADLIEANRPFISTDPSLSSATVAQPPSPDDELKPEPANWEAALQSLAEEDFFNATVENEPVVTSADLVFEEPAKGNPLSVAEVQPETEPQADVDTNPEPQPLFRDVLLRQSDSSTPSEPEKSGQVLFESTPVDSVLSPFEHSDQSTQLTETSTTQPSSRYWPWIVAHGFLGLLLIGQCLHHYRHQLLRDAQIGPYVASLYASLGVPLPPPADLTFFTSQLLDTIPDPEVPNTLRIRANITNNATFAQPYPWIQLNLEDRFGIKMGRRNFSPDEYKTAQGQTLSLLTPGESAAIELVIVNPGEDAVEVGVHFDTCLPLTNGFHCTHESKP